MNKRPLSERDICTKFITSALRQAGWDEMLQIREEVGPRAREDLAGEIGGVDCDLRYGAYGEGDRCRCSGGAAGSVHRSRRTKEQGRSLRLV